MPRKSSAANAVPVAAPAAELFVKIGASGEELPLDAAPWEAVKHLPTGLLFAAELPAGEVVWKKAFDKAASLKLAGRSDWRLATRVEALHIIDDTRFRPAVDTRFFRYPESGWLWTATKDAEFPESGAWLLGLDYGFADFGAQDGRGFALAVCGPAPSPGQ